MRGFCLIHELKLLYLHVKFGNFLSRTLSIRDLILSNMYLCYSILVCSWIRILFCLLLIRITIEFLFSNPYGRPHTTKIHHRCCRLIVVHKVSWVISPRPDRRRYRVDVANWQIILSWLITNFIPHKHGVFL